MPFISGMSSGRILGIVILAMLITGSRGKEMRFRDAGTNSASEAISFVRRDQYSYCEDARYENIDENCIASVEIYGPITDQALKLCPTPYL